MQIRYAFCWKLTQNDDGYRMNKQKIEVKFSKIIGMLLSFYVNLANLKIIPIGEKELFSFAPSV